MDIKEIRQLVKLMVENDLSELDIINGEDKIALKRGWQGSAVIAEAPAPVQAPPVAATVEPPTDTKPVQEFVEIKSPMVGTFYASASPDSDVYIQVGAPVGEESVVCIIDAMKVMNEIKAGCSGTIAEICVKNAQPVEFGQILFRVNPS